jgi:hypothetical protein
VGVYDIPSSSKFIDTIRTVSGFASFYDFLRVWPPLEAGVVVVRYLLFLPSFIRYH